MSAISRWISGGAANRKWAEYTLAVDRLSERRALAIDWRAVAVGALAVAGAAVLGSVLLSAPAAGPDRLQALLEAAIRFPGSEPLSEGKIERSEDIVGRTNAQWWMILGTNASIGDVLAFYDTDLATRGWDERKPTVPATTDIAAYKWTRDNLRFRLGFYETEEWYLRIEGKRPLGHPLRRADH